VEHRFHALLQHHGHHRLRDSVRDRWHTQDAYPAAVRFGYLHRSNRRWEIASRRHTVPYLVQIRIPVPFELFDGHPSTPAAPLLCLTL
jgi:hypothetical protein